MKSFIKITLIPVFLFVVLIAIEGKGIYVSMNGSDDAPGTLDKPVAGITAASRLALPGDTVFVRSGGYHVKEQIRILSSGTPGHVITYMPYPGEEAAFNVDLIPWPQPKAGEHYSPTVGALQIENVHHIKVEDIGIRYSHRAGIIIRNSSDIELNRCIIDNTYNSGIGVWYSDNVRVLYCDVSQANDQGKRMPFDRIGREAPHEAISIAGGRNFEIAYNHVHLCYKEGIDCKEVSAHGKVHHNYIHDNSRQGIYVDAWFGMLEDIDVYENTIFRCEYGIGISVECDTSSMRNVRFHHNLIYDNRGSGVVIGVWGKNGPRSNIQITNNTICNNGSPAHWSGATGGIDVRSENIFDIRIAYNICYNNFAYQIATFDDPADGTKQLDAKKIDIRSNLCYPFRNLTNEPGEFKPVYAFNGSEVITADPLFSDYANAGFHLKKGSPAINQSFPGGILGALPTVRETNNQTNK